MPMNHTSQYADLTDEQYCYIGKVVIEWSNVESILKSILSSLLFTPEFVSRVYTERLSASSLEQMILNGVELHKIRYHCKIIHENTLDEIEEITKGLSSLRGKRNKFAHLCWARTSHDEISGFGFSSATYGSKRCGKDFVSFTVDELKAFHEELYQVVEQFMKLRDTLPEMPEELISKKLLYPEFDTHQ